MIDRISTSDIRINTADKNKNQAFKGAPTALLTGLRGLNNSPALGACAVDLCSMVIPRTAIEMKNRGPQSGIEAAFREGSSCLIHACVGLIGLGAATLLSGKFNAENALKAQNIFANQNSINNMAVLWDKSANQKEFFNSFVQNISGLNGKRWKGVSTKARSEIVESLVQIADKSQALETLSGKDKTKLAKEIKDLKGIVLGRITKDTGAQASFKLKAIQNAEGNLVKGVSSSLGELVDNAVVLSNSFKTKSKTDVPKFAKSLIKNKNMSTALGLGICAVLCMAVQPVNRYLTKRRTGQDGFVGVDGGKTQEQSKGFKIAKTAAGIAFPAFAIKSIGKFSDFASNVQFNSKIPTLNQFKLLYGLTIGSRFMSARDPNELRESVIRDTLGYTNWLILGGVVSKLVARGVGGKDLINNPVAQEGKKGIGYAFKWLTQASVKSFDEVLLPKAKEITKNGKMMKFSELYKGADKITKGKIAKIAGSQVAGYLYSGLVLGVGIAKLNIFITKQINGRKKAKENMDEKIVSNIKADNTKTSQKTSFASNVFKDFN